MVEAASLTNCTFEFSLYSKLMSAQFVQLIKLAQLVSFDKLFAIC